MAPGAKVGDPTEGVGAWTVAMETDAKLTSWSEEGSKQHEGGTTWCMALCIAERGLRRIGNDRSGLNERMCVAWWLR